MPPPPGGNCREKEESHFSATQRPFALFGLLITSVRHFDKFKLSKPTQDTKNGNYLNISKTPCEQLTSSQSSTWPPASHHKPRSCGPSIGCSFMSSSLTVHVSASALCLQIKWSQACKSCENGLSSPDGIALRARPNSGCRVWSQ